MSVPPRLAILPALVLLAGCDRGLSACEEATKAALAVPGSYERIAAVEEPGETPAMTYHVIDYTAQDPSGGSVRERAHCAYWRDTGEAELNLLGPATPR